MAKKITFNPKIHVNPSGPIPPAAKAGVYRTTDFLNGPAPVADASPTRDPAVEAAKHAPPDPEK